MCVSLPPRLLTLNLMAQPLLDLPFATYTPLAHAPVFTATCGRRAGVVCTPLLTLRQLDNFLAEVLGTVLYCCLKSLANESLSNPHSSPLFLHSHQSGDIVSEAPTDQLSKIRNPQSVGGNLLSQKEALDMISKAPRGSSISLDYHSNLHEALSTLQREDVVSPHVRLSRPR